jgi:transposase
MAELGRKTQRYPSDLTDEEWVRIEPLLPKPSRRGRKPTVDLREVLNAIRYMACSAGGWPSEKNPRSLMRSWTNCCPGRRPARRSTVAGLLFPADLLNDEGVNRAFADVQADS